MDFETLRSIGDEAERTMKLYDEVFVEDDRLKSRAAQVEFLTTVKYVEEYISPGAKILDIGAGAGAYSLYFGARGYEVEAIDLSERNVETFRQKITPDMRVRVRQGNALDLSEFAGGSFDAVFCFGPLYHLKDRADRSRVIFEALRVLRQGKAAFFSFINHDMIHMTELMYDDKYFLRGDYDHKTMRLTDFPFVFHTPPECRELLTANGVRILREIASDGASELIAPIINKMDDESYAQYLKYHFYRCEKPELMGFTNHLLYVGEKQS